MDINSIDRFNLHDPSILGLIFAETGFVYYKITPNKTPYIFQYMVCIDWPKHIPAYIHIPLTWAAYRIEDYCLPDYAESIWEWGPLQLKSNDWRPTIEYIKDKYVGLGAALYVPDQPAAADKLTFPILYTDEFFR